MEKNCYTCKYSFLTRCKTLKARPEYKAYQSGAGLEEWYNFKKEFVCSSYESKFIQYPIEVTQIDREERINLGESNIGRLVRIKLCGNNEKTHLGLFLGDLPIDVTIKHNSASGKLKIGFIENPAIFVFDLNKIAYGVESFWEFIDSAEELKEIDQETIDNQWYIKLWRDYNVKD